MSTAIALAIHFIVSLVKLARPGGARGLLAETMLVKQQLIVMTRGRRRAPDLTAFDRVFSGLCCLLMTPGRIVKAAVVLRSATSIWRPSSTIGGRYIDDGLAPGRDWHG